MSYRYGYINVTTTAGSISRSKAPGIDMGMFDFVSAEHGIITTNKFEKEKGEKVSIKNDDIVELALQAADELKTLAKGKLPVIVMDGARTNTSTGGGIFDVNQANLLKDNEWCPLTGSRSMKSILTLLGKWEDGTKKEDAQYRLRCWQNQYTEQELNIERALRERGVLVVFLPHSHPELAFIEYYWRSLKSAARATGSSSKPVLREALDEKQATGSGPEKISRHRAMTESFFKYYLDRMDSSAGDQAGEPIDRIAEHQANSRFGQTPWNEGQLAKLAARPDEPLNFSKPSSAWKEWIDGLREELHMCNMICRFGEKFPVGQQLWEAELPVGVVSAPPKSKKQPAKRKKSRAATRSASSESSASDSNDVPGASGRGSVPGSCARVGRLSSPVSSAALDFMIRRGASQSGRACTPILRQ
jgi:hypothetical protein